MVENGDTPKAVLNAARQSGPRVQRFETDGQIYWIKRPEVLSWRMRLQKGDPARAFAAEIATHRDYAARGLPVARWWMPRTTTL